MKKYLLTALIAFCTTLFASAQFMVVTTYDGDLDDTDQFTQKAGVGYMATDAFTVGMNRSYETDTNNVNSDIYEFFARYTVKDNIWLAFSMPTKDGTDKMKVGAGFSFQLYNGLYFDPNYTIPVKEVDGKREGSANFSISYRF